VVIGLMAGHRLAGWLILADTLYQLIWGEKLDNSLPKYCTQIGKVGGIKKFISADVTYA
jgi:hypothetical protein